MLDDFQCLWLEIFKSDLSFPSGLKENQFELGVSEM